jgi:hypothetical protein
MSCHRLKISSLILLMSLAISCISRNLSPPELQNRSPSKSISATLKDGNVIALKNIHFKNDKLIGETKDRNIREIELSMIKFITITEFHPAVPILGALLVAIPLAAFLTADDSYQKKIDRAPHLPPPTPIESCPFIYAYDGERYVFEAEPYGGAICRGLERAEWARLDYLENSSGSYKLLIANQLDETQYTDEAKLVIVDHPQGATIVADIVGRMHTFSTPQLPLSASDHNGVNILPAVAANDLLFWQSDLEGRDPEIKENAKDELIFKFHKPKEARTAKLMVNAWTTLWGSQVAKEFLGLFGLRLKPWLDEIDSFGPANREMWNWYFSEDLYTTAILVQTRDGWKPQGRLYGGGPFIAKEKAYALDIGDVPGDSLKIKITPAAGFWRLNSVGIDYTPDAPVEIAEVKASEVRDKNGRDVAALLEKDDDRYLVLPEIGDTAELSFPVPRPNPGQQRTIFLKIKGYYDIHLEPQGEPQTELIGRIFHEPGFAAQFALKRFQANHPEPTEKNFP